MWAEHAVNHRAKPTLKTNHPIHKTVIKYYIVAALFIQTDMKRYNFCPQCDILIVRLDNASNIEITVRIGPTQLCSFQPIMVDSDLNDENLLRVK